jgi:hypothetical protein
MNRSLDGNPGALSISPRVESDKRKALPAVCADAIVRGSIFRDNPFRSNLSRNRNAENRKVRVKRSRMRMDITWVTDRIAVGGGIWTAENMAAIARAGITHIIDMQIEFDDTTLAKPYGIAVCWNPIDDDFEPKPPEVFERGVDFALAALEEDGTKLYVHCAAGVHRAPMMTLALLGVTGWTVEDGMDLIEGRRPVADFAEVYVRSVEDFLQGRL